MTNEEIVLAWSDAFMTGSVHEGAQYMADHFVFTGPPPVPMNKEAYLGMMRAMRSAFPDLSNSLEITSETGHQVQGSLQMAGTHTHDFDLSPMGMPALPATGKSFRLPRESFTVIVREGKITHFHVEVPEGGGLQGLLAQLGAAIPA